MLERRQQETAYARALKLFSPSRGAATPRCATWRSLERRQELRELHAELVEHDGAFEPAPRMRKATSALAELDDDVTQRLATLNAVAVAGEELIRDQEIDALARKADEALARLTSAGPAIASDAGSERAERTEAVLRAYRELN